MTGLIWRAEAKLLRSRKNRWDLDWKYAWHFVAVLFEKPQSIRDVNRLDVGFTRY